MKRIVDFSNTEQARSVGQFLNLKEGFNNVSTSHVDELFQKLREDFGEEAAKEAISPFTDVLNFYEELKGTEDEDLNEVITYFVESSIKAAYLPAVFKKEKTNELVVKVGDKNIPLKNKGYNEEIGRVQVEKGNLKGSLEFKEEKTQQNDLITTGYAQLKGKNGNFTLRVILDPEKYRSAAEIESFLEEGGNVIEILREIPSQAIFTKFRDLEVGDHPLKGISKKDSQWGEQIILHLEDGQQTAANSKIAREVRYSFNFLESTVKNPEEVEKKVSDYYAKKALRIVGKTVAASQVRVEAKFIDKQDAISPEDSEESEEMEQTENVEEIAENQETENQETKNKETENQEVVPF